MAETKPPATYLHTTGFACLLNLGLDINRLVIVHRREYEIIIANRPLLVLGSVARVTNLVHRMQDTLSSVFDQTVLLQVCTAHPVIAVNREFTLDEFRKNFRGLA